MEQNKDSSKRISLFDAKQWKYLRKLYKMTPREIQVAILTCKGLNNDEISKALKIRPGTVKTHLRNVYRRVRISNKILMLLRFLADTKNFR